MQTQSPLTQRPFAVLSPSRPKAATASKRRAVASHVLTHAISSLSLITGWPLWFASNIIRWRAARGYVIAPTHEVE